MDLNQLLEYAELEAAGNSSKALQMAEETNGVDHTGRRQVLKNYSSRSYKP